MPACYECRFGDGNVSSGLSLATHRFAAELPCGPTTPSQGGGSAAIRAALSLDTEAPPITISSGPAHSASSASQQQQQRLLSPPGSPLAAKAKALVAAAALMQEEERHAGSDTVQVRVRHPFILPVSFDHR